MKLKLSFALAAALLVFGQSAHATQSATGSLTNFRVTLIDLDPDDGVTPFLSFNPVNAEVDGTALRAKAYSFGPDYVDYAADGSFQLSEYQGNVLSPGKVEAIVDLANASAQSAATFMTVSVSANLTGLPGAPAEGIADATASVQAFNGWRGFDQLTISANTLAIFEGDLFLQASLDPTGPLNFVDAASVSFRFGGDLLIPGGTQGFSLGYTAEVSANYVLWDPAANYNPSLNVPIYGALANTTPGSLGGSLYMSLDAYAQDRSVTVVPEPGTWALTLLGMAGLALAKTRRR